MKRAKPIRKGHGHARGDVGAGKARTPSNAEPGEERARVRGKTTAEDEAAISSMANEGPTHEADEGR